MDIFQLILVCSVVQTDPHQTLLYQISQTADASATYVDDLTATKVYDPDRKKIAHKIVRSLVRQNHDVRVGLTQVPAETAIDTYGAAFPELVRGCTSISFGSQHLRKARRKFPDSRLKALAWYFTGAPDSALGRGWAAEVLRQPAVHVEQSASNPDSAPPSKTYSSPQHQIFSNHSMDLDSEQLPRDRSIFQKDSRNRSSSGSSPSKFPPPDKHDEIDRRSAPTKRDSSTTALDQPSSDASAADRRQTLRPKPDVTDMTLPTTQDLDTAEHPADRNSSDSDTSSDSNTSSAPSTDSIQ